MFAIICDGGHQLRVEEGQELELDYRSDAKTGDELVFDRVLAVSDGEQFRVGKPVVEGSSVKAEVLGVSRGDKIIVQKFRRRKNSRRKQGHRQYYTRVRISKIES